ncbi:MAG: hypothetical protein L0Z62_36485 [Gemmataceae bacterium]|nr:hypothetical protein [Gemmataceae bacterium]
MRVGSFVVMREPSTKGWDAIHFIPKEPVECFDSPARIAYEREQHLEYLNQVLLFLQQNRLPTDPGAWDILMQLWPDLKPQLEQCMLEDLKQALLHEPKENPDEHPDLPF